MILVISSFGFEGWIWVLIPSVPDLCILLTFNVHFQEIARSYGDLLSSKRQHEDAAIMYVKGESWDHALESYMACNHWQQVFCITAHLKYTPEQQLEAAKKVGGSLLPI